VEFQPPTGKMVGLRVEVRPPDHFQGLPVQTCSDPEAARGLRRWAKADTLGLPDPRRDHGFLRLPDRVENRILRSRPELGPHTDRYGCIGGEMGAEALPSLRVS